MPINFRNTMRPRQRAVKARWEVNGYGRTVFICQIDEAIKKQQEAVDKVKSKYDDEQKKLKELQRKKEQKALKAISGAMKKSTKTYEEVIEFILS